MSSDTEIDTVEGLIKAIVHAANTYERAAVADQEQAARLIPIVEILRQRRDGLQAHMIALGGRPSPRLRDVDMMSSRSSLEAAQIEAPDGLEEQRASLKSAFKNALEDRRLASSTRAAIITAWNFIENAIGSGEHPTSHR